MGLTVWITGQRSFREFIYFRILQACKTFKGSSVTNPFNQILYMYLEVHSLFLNIIFDFATYSVSKI